MLYDLVELPGAAWVSITGRSLAVSVVLSAVSVLGCTLFFALRGESLDVTGFAAATFVPILLGTPVLFYQFLKHQQLRQSNQKLEVLASTDWLTSCLNRRAFTNQVTRNLTRQGAGAFLVIDADHFKAINDHFGHECGDQALQIMAQTIKSKVREGDLVGRIGGEEFGVFLADADIETARKVAERIRGAIHALDFAPDGTVHGLSVSVGGAFYDQTIGFAELFRIADQMLYGVKQAGRNRVEVVYASDHPPVRLSQPAYS